MGGGGWRYILGVWTFFMGVRGRLDIFHGWLWLGGSGWSYILGAWGWVDIFWVEFVGGGMFYVGGGVWTFFMGV